MNKDRSVFKQRFEINIAVAIDAEAPFIPRENGIANVPGMDYFKQLSSDECFRIKDYWLNNR